MTMICFLAALVFLITGAHAFLDITKDVMLPTSMHAVVEPLSLQANELFSSDAPLALEYSIFSGQSALRKLPPQYAGTKRLISLQLLLRKQLDAAHDVVLGADWNNLEEAEYAATHRGQTNWTQEHPLSDEDDMVHSIIHRLEGDLEGEGGHTGWENAKFWIAGGPKMCKYLGKHPVHEAMCRLCPEIAPTLGHLLVAKKLRRHEIIAGGEKRTVWIEKGCFDPISYVSLCQYAEWNDELKSMQVIEMLLLIRLELLTLYGESDTTLLLG